MMTAWPIGVIAALSVSVGLNLIMLAVATAHRPVMETDRAWTDALTHEQVIESRRASWALNWTVTLDAPRPALLIVVASDANGAPVAGQSATVALTRPDDAALDVKITLIESSPGEYTGTLPNGARAGWWRAALRLSGPSGTYLDDRRVRIFGAGASR